MLDLCQSLRSGRQRRDERFSLFVFYYYVDLLWGNLPSFCFLLSLSLLLAFHSFFFHSFIHVFNSFILFIHSFAWLLHEYMDVLLLCWFQKKRTYEQKGRTGGEVKSILYTQQRRRHTKTTHVGQKKEVEKGEREK